MAKGKGYLNLGLGRIITIILAIIPFTSWILGAITRLHERALDCGDPAVDHRRRDAYLLGSRHHYCRHVGRSEVLCIARRAHFSGKSRRMRLFFIDTKRKTP